MKYGRGTSLFPEVSDVKFPDSLTEIGDYSFYGNNNLTELTIPDNVTSIGEFSFGECKNLNLTIDNNASFARSAFSGGIKSITFINHSSFVDTTVIDFLSTIYNKEIFYTEKVIIKGTNMTKEKLEEALEKHEYGYYSPSESIQRIEAGTLFLSAE